MNQLIQKRKKGQAAVEFALLLPLFLAVVFGVVEFGRFFWEWNMVYQAVNAGARAVSTTSSSNTGAITQAAKQATVQSLPAGMGIGIDDVQVTVPADINADPVTVSADLDFESPLSGFFSIFGFDVPPTFTVRAQAFASTGSPAAISVPSLQPVIPNFNANNIED